MLSPCRGPHSYFKITFRKVCTTCPSHCFFAIVECPLDSKTACPPADAYPILNTQTARTPSSLKLSFHPHERACSIVAGLMEEIRHGGGYPIIVPTGFLGDHSLFENDRILVAGSSFLAETNTNWAIRFKSLCSPMPNCRYQRKSVKS